MGRACRRLLLVLQAAGTRTTYGYEARGQLTREWRTGGLTPVDATFGYDPSGNRELLIDSGARTTSAYDAADQLTRRDGPGGRTTFAHDAACNRTRTEAPAAVTYFAWDARNRLTEPPRLKEPTGAR